MSYIHTHIRTYIHTCRKLQEESPPHVCMYAAKNYVFAHDSIRARACARVQTKIACRKFKCKYGVSGPRASRSLATITLIYANTYMQVCISVCLMDIWIGVSVLTCQAWGSLAPFDTGQTCMHACCQLHQNQECESDLSMHSHGVGAVQPGLFRIPQVKCNVHACRCVPAHDASGGFHLGVLCGQLDRKGRRVHPHHWCRMVRAVPAVPGCQEDRGVPPCLRV